MKSVAGLGLFFLEYYIKIWSPVVKKNIQAEVDAERVC